MTSPNISSDAIIPLFESGLIRSLKSMDEPGWIPVVDLTKAWGLDRTTLFKHISRNPDDFPPSCARLVDILSTTGENERVLCVNEVGMYQLLSRVSISRLKNPAAREAIRKFRQDIPKFLQQFRKHEIMQVQPDTDKLDEVVAYDLKEAKQIAELTGTDPRAMQAAILEKHGYPELAKVLSRQLPAIQSGEAGIWLNPTQIGARCGHSAREVNNFLEWHRFQYRGPDGLWRLTDKGELHGEEYEYPTVSKHIEIRIRWRESILTASGLIRPESERLQGVRS